MAAETKIAWHCDKCRRASLRWTEPKPKCGHAALTFGCRGCSGLSDDKADWEHFHSAAFTLPTCGDCGEAMMCWDSAKGIMEFCCPKMTEDGELYCDDEKANKTVRLRADR